MFEMLEVPTAAYLGVMLVFFLMGCAAGALFSHGMHILGKWK